MTAMASQRGRSRYWLDSVDTKHGDWFLYVLCLVQGMLDCMAFKNWSTFIGGQTGNTIILCLSTSGYPVGQPYAWATTLQSIVSFFVGSFTLVTICSYLRADRRLTFTVNILVQSLLITLVAALATSGVLVNVQNHDPLDLPSNPHVLIGIAPLAFQSGMSISTSRLLGFGDELPITVLTSTYAALAGDPQLFKPWTQAKSVFRNRRAVAIVMVVIGALIAAAIEKKSIGMVAVLWMAAGIKMVLVVAVAGLFPQKMELARTAENV